MKIIVTNSFAQVEGSKHAQFLVHHALRYLVPNHHQAIKKAGRKWDGYKSLHDRKSKQFPAGLLPVVIKYLESIKCHHEIVDLRKRPANPSWPISLSGIELRDYQAEAAVKFLNAGQGILKLGTGAGKTEVAVAITKAISQPTMFLTHRVNLLYQSAERFVKRWPDCKNKIGIIGDGNFQFGEITFATVQTLHNAIRKYGKQAKDELKQYRVMIVDEAHRIGAAQFHQCAKALVNAYWRLGLTATPFMSDDPADNLHLMGAIGGVIHEVSPSTLIEAGVLAKPYFKFHIVNQPSLSHLTNWRDIYEQGIVKNAFRNNVIAANTASLVKMGYKPLVIVTEVAHGKILAEMIGEKGIKCDLITGVDDVQRRVHALKDLSSGRLQCIVCSNIFDEGVDVQDVSGIVLAAGTKSAPALFQRTGRAIRKKEDGGNAVIVDFIDRQHPTLERHSLQRYKLVKSEPGFAIIQ